MKNRLPEIDDLRGIAIIVMILIHTNAYFLHNLWAYTTREISQFAVVAFLFCSAYLTLQKPYPTSPSAFFSAIIKRLKRLIIPYYIFFIGYIVFMNIINNKHFSDTYIASSLLLIGGIDFGWLVLLFIELMFITPLLQYLFDQHRIMFMLYNVIALLSSVLFLRYTPLSSYRFFMWLPWSLVVSYTFYFDALWHHKLCYIMITLLFGIIFIATQQLVLVPLHHSLSMYDNKYPPNLYHLSYSLFAVNSLYLLSKLKLFSSSLVQDCVHFFSINSYSLFFIHIVVIEGVWKWLRPTNWILFFLLVVYLSVLVQLGFNWVYAKLQKPVKK